MTDQSSQDYISKNRARLTAAALLNDPANSALPQIVAAGRGIWAEQILELAHLNGIKVREDPALAEILASIELDSPIPTEAIMAVAEILAYVYDAEGKGRPDSADPFKVPPPKEDE